VKDEDPKRKYMPKKRNLTKVIIEEIEEASPKLQPHKRRK
jgi:hypothetical protein